MLRAAVDEGLGVERGLVGWLVAARLVVGMSIEWEPGVPHVVAMPAVARSLFE